MASIFKRGKGRNEPYVVQYFDHRGKRRTKIGFTDKGLTEELAAKLETEARLRSTGLIDPQQDRFAQQKAVPIKTHLDAFQESLEDNTGKHVRLTMTRVRRIVEGCGFKTLADIESEPVQVYLRRLRKEEDLGHRTYNHYLQAMDAFCNWCVATKRLIANPILGLERLNTEVDVRHARRALTAEEVAKLVDSARQSHKRIQGFSGEMRARIYLMSYMTGLRKKELASLSPRSFALDAEQPTVTVEAACSKHRRKDVLPLHPDLVVMLREWLKGMKPTDKLFPNLDRKKTWFMVRKDLERVGIPYENEDGIADFHSCRHTYITHLLSNGATLPQAKELARHSDVKMTMKYTHIGLGDQAKALANLPSPKQAEPATNAAQADDAALQMRCIFCGADRHPVTCDGNDEADPKRRNPCGCKGFDDDRRSVSEHVKMEAAGIEPPFDSGVTSHALCDCINGQHPRAAHALQLLRANRRESASNGTHCQSVHLPPEVIRIAESWSSLPPHIREAIQSLVDTASPIDQSRHSRSDSQKRELASQAAWHMAQECRNIIQSCLREEEWPDADREFFGVIANGLARL